MFPIQLNEDTLPCATGRLLEFLYGFPLLSNTTLCKELPFNIWCWHTKTHGSPETHLANCYLCGSVSEPSEFPEANISFTMTFQTIPKHSAKAIYWEEKEILQENDEGRGKINKGNFTRVTEGKTFFTGQGVISGGEGCDSWSALSFSAPRNRKDHLSDVSLCFLCYGLSVFRKKNLLVTTLCHQVREHTQHQEHHSLMMKNQGIRVQKPASKPQERQLQKRASWLCYPQSQHKQSRFVISSLLRGWVTNWDTVMRAQEVHSPGQLWKGSWAGGQKASQHRVLPTSAPSDPSMWPRVRQYPEEALLRLWEGASSGEVHWTGHFLSIF